MSGVKVFLGCEGSNELGSRCGHPVYQTDHKPGVIETLLRQVQRDGWEVHGAIQWKDITKLQVSSQRDPPEVRNVLGLALEAKRKQSAILAFVRDADDDKARPKQIANAIQKANETFPEVEIIGGTAIPVLEAWMLAIHDVHGTESLGKAAAQSKLVALGVPSKDTTAMVDMATKASLEKLPQDATTLRAWLTRANEVLPP